MRETKQGFVLNEHRYFVQLTSMPVIIPICYNVKLANHKSLLKLEDEPCMTIVGKHSEYRKYTVIATKQTLHLVFLENIRKIENNIQYLCSRI
jgi:hypothetical protein